MLPSAVASAYLSYPAHYMHKSSIAEPFFITPQGRNFQKCMKYNSFIFKCLRVAKLIYIGKRS